jgi:hypothetical protein
VSDIDVLLVHPPFPGDPKPPKQKRLLDSFAQKWSEPLSASATEAKRWPGQVDRLRGRIRAWTGNSAQIVDLSWGEWLTHKDDKGVFEEIRRDGIDVTPRSASVMSMVLSEG